MFLGLGLGLTARRRATGLLNSPALVSQWNVGDYSRIWQDTAGTTPVTASAQSVGKIADLKGANNLVAFADAARPLSTAGLTFDGTDDRMGFDATLPANADFVCIYKSSDLKGCIVSDRGGTASFLGQYDSASASTSINAAGGSIIIGGVTFAGTTRQQLQAALCTGAALVVEFRGANLSAWSGLTLGAYVATLASWAQGPLIPVALLDAANGDIANARTLARTEAQRQVTALGL